MYAIRSYYGDLLVGGRAVVGAEHGDEGLGVAAGELASGWDFIGAGSGLVTPLLPDTLGESGIFFYYSYNFV